MKVIFIFAVLSLLVGCQSGHKGHKGHMKKMWKTMDKDGDGALSKVEFQKGHEEIFAKMDANSDGKVTMEEKKSFKKKMHKKH